MKNRIIAIILVSIMILCLAACGGNKKPDTNEELPSQKNDTAGQNGIPDEDGDNAETRIFTDDCGRKVEIPAKINAIVPSGPLAQIVLFAIVPEMFVGLAYDWNDTAEGIIPDEYLSLPFLGQLYGSADLSVEELALCAPQLIIDIGEAKKSIVEDMDALQKQTMIPSVHIEATLETMPEVYRTLGELLDRNETGERLASFCEKVYNRTSAIMKDVGDERVNALYILGEDGLNVLAKGSYHAELIDMLISNLAEVENPSSKGLGNEVTMEQIALWNPDFIIFAPGSIYSSAKERDTWNEIPAISNGKYIEVPESPINWLGSPPSVQRYLGLIWLPAAVYPELSNYDVKTEILEYYELFYHVVLTDTQYDTIIKNAFVK